MNTFDDRRVGELLHDASDNAPASRVDLGAAVRDGRRRRLRRRLVAPLAVAAAVAVALGAVASVQLWTQGLIPVPPATPAPTASPLTEFPLDRQLFALDGAGELRALGLTRQFQNLRYSDVEVQVFAVGVALPDPGSVMVVAGAGPPLVGEPERVPAPPVNGRPANFVRVGSDPVERLRLEFQWAEGAWAIVSDRSLSEESLLAAAAGLRPADEPVRTLFSVQPPPGYQLAVVVPFTAAEEARYAALEFTTNGSIGPTQQPLVSVRVEQYFDSALDPVINAEIDGRPAHIEQWADSFSVEMRDTDPYSVKVVVLREALSMADAQALAASVVIHGTWEDRSQWTDDPLR